MRVIGNDSGGSDPESGYGWPASADASLDTLAARAASDDGALDRLLRELERPVVRYCRSRLGGGGRIHSADDVAQEVMLAVVSALPRYRPGSRHFMAFVYGIARNKVNDVFRAAGRDHSRPVEQFPDSPTEHDDGPESRALLAVDRDRLGALLETLNPDQREILVLRIGLGMSSEETARTIGSTPGAVRVSQHRALTRLRSLVDAPGTPW